MALSWFWAADLQKLMVFCDFQIARATLCGLSAGRPSKTRGFLRFSNRSRDPLRSFAWSNRSRCGAVLIFLKLRTLNRCRASGICSRTFLARARNRGRAIGIASEALLILPIFNSPARPSAEFRVVESLSLWRGAHFDEAARPKPLPSQWDLHQCKLAASSKPSPSHGNCF